MTATPETVGLISDVHANLPALEAVLDAMPPIDSLVHAGDVIGYGPWPNACVERLRDQDAYSVRGNHDELVCGGPVYESGDAYADQTLTKANREWIKQCPIKKTLFDGRVTVAHGHPDDQSRYMYPNDFEAELLDDENILVLGHTHHQAKAEFSNGIVVNPGSVGQPRDGDERAAYAVLDLVTEEIQLHRVGYDIGRVESKIESTGIRSRNARRLYKGK